MPDIPGEPLPPLNPQTKEPAGPAGPAADLPDGAHPPGGLARAARSRSRRRSARRTSSGARRRCTARGASSGRSGRRRTSTTSTRASRPPARTSRTPRCRRRTRTRGPASASSRPRRAPGQWGSSLAFACSLFGLECEVFMVGSSYDQKPYRRSMMETWGATVHRSPSRADRAGSPTPSHPTGSLGIAISEAVEIAAQSRGHELRAGLGAQPRAAAPDGDRPGDDRADGAGRGGAGRRHRAASAAARTSAASSSRGCARDLQEGAATRFLAAEPAACPTLTKGVYAYDYGDTAGLTPLMPMYTLGHDFVPPPVHAGRPALPRRLAAA